MIRFITTKGGLIRCLRMPPFVLIAADRQDALL